LLSPEDDSQNNVVAFPSSQRKTACPTGLITEFTYYNNWLTTKSCIVVFIFSHVLFTMFQQKTSIKFESYDDELQEAS
jgi:hypothetical protein